ncbi:hypothetical protein VTN00DRAFT_9330 [Thermoascus crustaceus]|uniref:uncharacterized protein n=1 Tax=Thermoascus crustaceus TaxID=5088 RepID=UPI00374422B6
MSELWRGASSDLRKAMELRALSWAHPGKACRETMYQDRRSQAPHSEGRMEKGDEGPIPMQRAVKQRINLVAAADIITARLPALPHQARHPATKPLVPPPTP